MCIISEFKEIFFLNLQQMVEVVRTFCWHQNFDHKDLSALAPGLHTCIKQLKDKATLNDSASTMEDLLK